MARPTAVTSATQEPRLGFRLYGTLALLSALAPLGTDFYLPGLPDISASLGTTSGLVQLTISINFVGLAIGQIVIGTLSDRIGRRRPLVACMALFVVFTVLCGLAPNIWVLLAARFAQGFVAGAVAIPRAIVRDMFPPSVVSKVFSQLTAVAMFAPVVAPVIGGAILAFTSWRVIFAALAVIAVVQLVLAHRVVPESLPPERRHASGRAQRRVMLMMLRDRRFAGFVVTAGLQGAQLMVYLSLSAFFLRDEYGVSTQGYSALFALNGLGLILASQINARLLSTQELPRVARLFALTTVTAIVSLLALIVAGAPLAAVEVALFVSIAASGPGIANIMGLAMTPMGHAAGTASALLGSSTFLIGAIVAAVVAHVSTSGVAMASTMAVAATLIAMLTWALTRRD
ncbi:multidrug effflux MFS transporter [Aeromicrobium wangtongii]|uniref:multidrug effflux MFS transporter n=1 Tax=Aeromicrobium wangtongii TaxID=2969247 RepID=UPI00201763C3|nr:multidrug effflux MFS transporter [Aeromicrobium wangtongii]MCL3819395.1 multidrug effflux MFS transporter [Aeromicrobium wangtongii]